MKRVQDVRQKLKRRYICIEKNEEFYNRSMERLNAFKKKERSAFF